MSNEGAEMSNIKTRAIPKQAQPSFYATTVAGLGKTAAAIVVTYKDIEEIQSRPRWSFEQADREARHALGIDS